MRFHNLLLISFYSSLYLDTAKKTLLRLLASNKKQSGVERVDRICVNPVCLAHGGHAWKEGGSGATAQCIEAAKKFFLLSRLYHPFCSSAAFLLLLLCSILPHRIVNCDQGAMDLAAACLPACLP